MYALMHLNIVRVRRGVRICGIGHWGVGGVGGVGDGSGVRGVGGGVRGCDGSRIRVDEGLSGREGHQGSEEELE